MPEISVIIPVYNVEKTLMRCVKSVMEQSYQDFECILVDDGSPDNCGKMCDDIVKEDKRFVVIHKENGGLSSARNVALNIAKGDYICFLDSDDLIHPKMLEIMVDEIKKSNSDMVTTGLKLFFEENCVMSEYTEVGFERLLPEDYIDNLYPKNFGKISVTACGKIYKKEIFASLRYPEGYIYEDLRVYLNVLQLCKQISVCDTSLYYYYQNPMSITQSKYLKYERFGEFEVRFKYIDFFEKRGLKEQRDMAENDYLTFFMRNYFAVKIKYTEKNKDIEPHVKVFKKNLQNIIKNPYICKMRKICAVLMLVSPKISYVLSKKTIPDCLINEMR